jgi:hypothetical protein
VPLLPAGHEELALELGAQIVGRTRWGR